MISWFTVAIERIILNRQSPNHESKIRSQMASSDSDQRQPDRGRQQPLERQRPRRDQRLEQLHLREAVLVDLLTCALSIQPARPIGLV